jgi:hypothetical protein
MKSGWGVLAATVALSTACSSPGGPAQSSPDSGFDGPGVGGSGVGDSALEGSTGTGARSCVTSEDCNPLVEFCEKNSCEATAVGTCAVMPGMRATYYCAPDDGGGLVCGCDGQTWPYACIAHAQAINVASEGPCPLPEGGGTCASNSDCGSGAYCKKSPCSAAMGTCEGEPSFLACSGTSPACGCDHQTYDNDCQAASYGVSVDFEGQCPPLPSGPCTSQSDCGDPTYAPLVFCEPTTCGNPSGTCTPVPGACPDIYMPVCGCDGKLYPNGCFAETARVGSYASDGGCP